MALELAESYLRPEMCPHNDDLPLVITETLDKPWGWVFFYTTQLFVETKDFSAALAGNGPFIIERKSGRILDTGTAWPIDFYLANYESTGDPYMQPGRLLEVCISNDGADRISAARLIARASEISIGDAKRGIDAVAQGLSFRVDAGSRTAAASLRTGLSGLGFSSSQLPELAV